MIITRHTTVKEKISVLDIYNPENDVKDVWYKLKTSLLDTEVYRTSKNYQWKKENWCWKDKVDEAIKQKRTLFNIYKVVDNKSKSNEVQKAKAAYTEAKSTSET